MVSMILLRDMTIATTQTLMFQLVVPMLALRGKQYTLKMLLNV